MLICKTDAQLLRINTKKNVPLDIFTFLLRFKHEEIIRVFQLCDLSSAFLNAFSNVFIRKWRL